MDRGGVEADGTSLLENRVAGGVAQLGIGCEHPRPGQAVDRVRVAGCEPRDGVADRLEVLKLHGFDLSGTRLRETGMTLPAGRRERMEAHGIPTIISLPRA